MIHAALLHGLVDSNLAARTTVSLVTQAHGVTPALASLEQPIIICTLSPLFSERCPQINFTWDTDADCYLKIEGPNAVNLSGKGTRRNKPLSPATTSTYVNPASPTPSSPYRLPTAPGYYSRSLRGNDYSSTAGRSRSCSRSRSPSCHRPIDSPSKEDNLLCTNNRGSDNKEYNYRYPDSLPSQDDVWNSQRQKEDLDGHSRYPERLCRYRPEGIT
ncbi:hypothetical protein BT96DRAFT_998571 [Gymnopus androsaceus JB14]|uniref:Uncharacterized protein n=1 Tax=Gymnopus androsaceus JB14 TaxID=1447944 RepID=A0A6A4HAW3_9AGAR|nr:hypothetical protein BT96DRAFT_998571 [Gymnopus androsaceus JB14]